MGVNTLLTLLTQPLLEIGADYVSGVLLFLLLLLEPVHVIVKGAEQCGFLLHFLPELTLLEFLGLESFC